MLQAWLSIGYIVLLAILVLAFILWRRGGSVLAIAALVVGIPLWFGWEYARPTWTTGVITGTEVRRSDPDARGNTTDIEYIYMRNRSDRGLELINDDSWWWLKRNSERVFNDAKTTQDRNTGNDPHVESVALHALLLIPQRDRHRPRQRLAVVVGANHHFLRPLRRPLAQLFLRLLQAAPIEGVPWPFLLSPRLKMSKLERCQFLTENLRCSVGEATTHCSRALPCGQQV